MFPSAIKCIDIFLSILLQPINHITAACICIVRLHQIALYPFVFTQHFLIECTSASVTIDKPIERVNPFFIDILLFFFKLQRC